MQQAEPVLHVASFGALVGSLAGYLPPVAAVISIVWGCICIYESKSFKRLKAYLMSDYDA